MSSTAISKNIQLIVAELIKRDLFAVIVPTADPHNSEYVAPCFQRRANLCGFKGSAGTCVVTNDNTALLWTDGRYWLDAEKSLDQGWKLMKQGDASVPSIEDWLDGAVQESKSATKKIGIDASTMLLSGWNTLVATGLEIVATEGNIVDAVLNEGGARSTPPVVKDSVILLTEEFAGLCFTKKIQQVVDELRNMKAELTLLTALDEVAWLLNLRCPSCCDIPTTPTFFSFAVITAYDAKCHLFIDEAKLQDSAKKALVDSGMVVIHPYNGLESFFSENKDNNNFKMQNVKTGIIAQSTASQYAYLLLQQVAGLRVKGGVKSGIVEELKAIKSEFELDSMRECHIRDGVALSRFLAWLDEEMASSSSSAMNIITEISAAEKLLEFRKQVEGFVSPSFETIPATGENGANAHYRPDPATPVQIKPEHMFLCDSGGQYLSPGACGTTDVTRTVVFDRVCPPPAHWKKAYSLVLKGHIRINTTVFPAGTTGHAIDALARLDLWRHAVTFRHGTGHGVGFMMNVHEGPFGIGMLPRASDKRGLQAGQVVSNEPGFYVSGEFGIRIENLDIVSSAVNESAQKSGKETLLCRVPEDKLSSMLLPSLKLESMTMTPLCVALIDKNELTESEVKWVNDYHEKCRKLLIPRIDKEVKDETEKKIVLKWIEKNCARI